MKTTVKNKPVKKQQICFFPTNLVQREYDHATANALPLGSRLSQGTRTHFKNATRG